MLSFSGNTHLDHGQEAVISSKCSLVHASVHAHAQRFVLKDDWVEHHVCAPRLDGVAALKAEVANLGARVISDKPVYGALVALRIDHVLQAAIIINEIINDNTIIRYYDS